MRIIISKRNLAIIKSFKRNRSYVKTGLIFDLSRQRVEQVIKKYAPELVKVNSPFQRYFSIYYGLPCLKCKKIIGVEVESAIHQYCRKDQAFYYDPNHQPRIKYTECSYCKRAFTKVKLRGYGLCNRCYSAYRYHTDFEYRKKSIEATKKYIKHRYATDPEWAQKRREYDRKYKST